jgi:hypothetical protein
MAGGLAAGLGGLAPADPPARLDQDWVLTLAARRSLWSDPVFADFNLGVRVREGQALVWGPVLTEDQAAEVVARVKLIAGIKGVVSELYVLPVDDLLRRKLQPAPPAPPPSRVTALALPKEKAEQPAVRPIPTRVADLIEEVRTKERRFRNLRVQVTNGVATVTGSVDRPADAIDFADKVRQLPGVANVVLRVDS